MVRSLGPMVDLLLFKHTISLHPSIHCSCLAFLLFLYINGTFVSLSGSIYIFHLCFISLFAQYIYHQKVSNGLLYSFFIGMERQVRLAKRIKQTLVSDCVVVLRDVLKYLSGG